MQSWELPLIMMSAVQLSKFVCQLNGASVHCPCAVECYLMRSASAYCTVEYCWLPAQLMPWYSCTVVCQLRATCCALRIPIPPQHRGQGYTSSYAKPIVMLVILKPCHVGLNYHHPDHLIGFSNGTSQFMVYSTFWTSWLMTMHMVILIIMIIISIHGDASMLMTVMMAMSKIRILLGSTFKATPQRSAVDSQIGCGRWTLS